MFIIDLTAGGRLGTQTEVDELGGGTLGSGSVRHEGDKVSLLEDGFVLAAKA